VSNESNAEKTLDMHGDTWRVLGIGVSQEGKTYVHLASTTKLLQQKNGFVPAQMCDWVDDAALASVRS
jgi:hypothetical protein